jgi:hypothetical protein
MRVHAITLKFTEEEKYALVEASHEARMNLSAWMRETLLGAAEANESTLPLARIKKPPHIEAEHRGVKDGVSTAQDLLQSIPGLQRGSEIEVLDRPRWVDENESVVIKVARGRLFGSNPLRKLSPTEAEFNKLAGYPWQKFNDQGRPLLDQHEMPILYE